MIQITALIILLIVGTTSTAGGFPATEVYKKVSDSVVLIISKKKEGNRIVGAGCIVAFTGTILTSSHLVIDKNRKEPYTNITIYLKPDKVTGNLSSDLLKKHSATVIEFNSDLDLALLKINRAGKNMNVTEFANSDAVNIGDEVIAIGHPEQGGLWTLTYGRISGEIDSHSGIEGKDVFQTDTSLNRGNSGGPLLNQHGRMVGMNSSIARLGVGHMPITGVNFAIKSSVIKRWLETIGIKFNYGRKPLKKLSDQVDYESERPLLPKRPYRMDDLFKEAEKEMEGVIKEMRQKLDK